MNEMSIDKHDAWVMILSTIRYSLGRQTYMTSLSWELAIKYASLLTKSQMKQIRSEIVKEMLYYRRSTRKKIPDQSTWLLGLRKLRKIERLRCH